MCLCYARSTIWFLWIYYINGKCRCASSKSSFYTVGSLKFSVYVFLNKWLIAMLDCGFGDCNRYSFCNRNQTETVLICHSLRMTPKPQLHFIYIELLNARSQEDPIKSPNDPVTQSIQSNYVIPSLLSWYPTLNWYFSLPLIFNSDLIET